MEPIAEARYKVAFTASAAFRDKLERLKALMRSSVPDGDLATILEEAVTEKLEKLEAKRYGKTKAPRKSVEYAAVQKIWAIRERSIRALSRLHLRQPNHSSALSCPKRSSLRLGALCVLFFSGYFIGFADDW